MKRIGLLFFAIFFIISNFYAQSTFPNYYSGSILVMSQEIQIELDFSLKSDTLVGIINIPIQGIKNMQLKKVTKINNKLTFEILPPPQNGVFEGQISADSIYGSFIQMGFKGTFSVTKTDRPVEDTTHVIKPYIEDEVTFKNGEITLAGTLSYPSKEGSFPAVILISGSGAQNRDSDIFGFKLFSIAADYFTRNGIAVLRYDDRGIGGSSGNVSQSTTEDFANDIMAGYELLKTKSFINPKKIGLYGHSEGGIVAPIAASLLNDAAFVVLVSAPGVSGDQVILKQLAEIMKAENADDSSIVYQVNNYKEVFDLLKNGSEEDTIKKLLYKQASKEINNLPDENKKTIKDLESTINQTVDQKLKQYKSIWFNFFVNYDPAPTLQNVKCPVLLLFGGKDKQVDIEQNRKVLEDNLKIGGNTNVKTILFENANHLYQEAKTGSPSEYAKLKKEYVTGFLEQVTEWIINTTAK
ncbi:MAG: alpha/beta fold hydrolase [bacterium]